MYIKTVHIQQHPAYRYTFECFLTVASGAFQLLTSLHPPAIGWMPRMEEEKRCLKVAFAPHPFPAPRKQRGRLYRRQKQNAWRTTFYKLTVGKVIVFCNNKTSSVKKIFLLCCGMVAKSSRRNLKLYYSRNKVRCFSPILLFDFTKKLRINLPFRSPKLPFRSPKLPFRSPKLPLLSAKLPF